MAGVLRGVVSQRLLPKKGGGRVAAVEVMVTNQRIADLIRENRADEIEDAIDEGEFFKMQSFQKALIDHVLSGAVEQDVAANAATSRHDFLVAVERARKQKAADEAAAAGEQAPVEEQPAASPLGIGLADEPQPEYAPLAPVAEAAAVAPLRAPDGEPPLGGLRLAPPAG
jgi:hypothetical protein